MPDCQHRINRGSLAGEYIENCNCAELHAEVRELQKHYDLAAPMAARPLGCCASWDLS